MRYALASLLLVTLALANGGCGLISADFEGTVKILTEVNGDDGVNRFESLELIDPNEYEDYRNNKDKIEKGEVTGIDIKIIRESPDNNATVVAGQVDIRPQGASEWTQGVADWNGVQVIEDNVFRVTFDPERQAELNRILFEDTGAVEMNLIGVSDQAPARFDLEVTVHLRFTASI